jgi:uncharacterized protein (DUF302 family)
MRKFIFTLFFLLVLSSILFADSGLVSVRSVYDVRETADRLESILKEKGMKIVARINHAGAAASVGMKLRPTELVIFGNPKVGTPLMQCNQTVAIDLPQKMLIWEDESGLVWIGYNDPQFLSDRHNVQDCDEVLRKIKAALSNFADAAAGR